MIYRYAGLDAARLLKTQYTFRAFKQLIYQSHYLLIQHVQLNYYTRFTFVIYRMTFLFIISLNVI